MSVLIDRYVFLWRLLKIVPQTAMYLRAGTWDRTRILLVFHPPRCTTASLPELADLISAVVLQLPQVVVLGDSNINAESS